MGDLWVFGYGSLMWNPGFDTVERRQATMYGLHRALCIHSWVHRGTQQAPGLVLGLDRGGCCRGIAFRTPARSRSQVIDYLRERELVTNVYLERWRKVRLDDARTVAALVYVVDRSHEQYAGRMSDDAIADVVTRANGRSGNNLDYVVSTVSHLREEGIHDPHLEAVSKTLSATE